jgi:hypothetical protein
MRNAQASGSSFSLDIFTRGLKHCSVRARVAPVYFHYAWSEEDKITIALPKGYTLDNADRPAPIKAGEVCMHTINMGVTKDETQLIYNSTFFFGGSDVNLFPVETYSQVKQLFDEIHKADNHMITLKQTTSSN